MPSRPQISFILATHNRRDVLAVTLQRVAECGLPASDFETIVVDNASTDGTAKAFAAWPGVRVIHLRRNLGSCAKAVAQDQARGRIIVFLDDDAYPRGGSIERMLRHFSNDRRLGAAGFTVHLPDGSRECSALPHVFVGCGVGFRGRALRAVGGLDPTFFMQAEEYDLSFRLLGAGWKVETFGDLAVEHMKTSTSRRPRRTTYYNIRNNLRVISRYLPPPLRHIYRRDWLRRYRWLAQRDGHQGAFRRGAIEGWVRGELEHSQYLGRRLSSQVVEQVFCWSSIRTRMEALRRSGMRRIMLLDLGKNVFAFCRGAREAGLRVMGIADDRFTAPARVYRGIPIVSMDRAVSASVEGYVVSNTSTVHAEARAGAMTTRTDLPVFNWFTTPPALGATEPEARSAGGTVDEIATMEARSVLAPEAEDGAGARTPDPLVPAGH